MMLEALDLKNIPDCAFDPKTLDKDDDPQKKQECVKLLNKIPREVLALCFTFLNAVELKQAELTCKRFYDAANLAGAWMGKPFRAEISDGKSLEFNLDSVFSRIIKYKYRKLTLISHSRSDKQISEQLAQLPELRLERVSLRGWVVIDQLSVFLSHCPHLTEVKFTSELTQQKLEDNFIKTLVSSCPKLISFCFSAPIHQIDLTPLTSLKCLNALRLKNCTKIRDDQLINLHEGISRLTHLDVRNTYATGEWLATLAPYCANLSTLKIGSQQYASQNLESLCASQHHLTTLNALHLFLPSLTPTDLDRLKTLGNKLIGLKIADPIIEDLKELWPRSPRLQKLSLPPLDRASLISLLNHCKSLIKFNGHFSDPEAPKLIMQALPHATSLEISLIASQELVTEQVWNFDGQWKQLTNLSLHNQPLSSETIFQLAERCPSLEFLNLTKCEAVKDAHVEKFLKNCPQLKELKLNFCKKLTPAIFRPCSLFRTNLVNFEF